jgi:hypothetical protein
MAVSSPANETYAGGAGVGAWVPVPCTPSDLPSTTDPQPLHRAQRWAATVSGLEDELVDYHVEAVDVHGHVTRSPIQHVWVGAGGGGAGGVTWTPAAPTRDSLITITVNGATRPGRLHWGVNQWGGPIPAYWPPGTTPWNGGPVVETPMALGPGGLTLTLGPFDQAGQPVTSLDFVIHYDDGTWDNNDGQDYEIAISGGGAPGDPWVMDGALDANAAFAASAGGADLHLGWNGSELYVATQPAPAAGRDVFVFVAGSRGTPVAAPWVKSGQVGSWAAFLANESTNNYNAWTDAQGATGRASGTWLEGTLNLAGELGTVPPVVYVAVGRYATQDGGALQGQVPAGDGNTHLEGAEFHEFTLVTAGVGGPPPGREPRLLPVSPNPVRSGTTFAFDLPGAGEATLTVYDVHGRRMAVPASGPRAAGRHRVRWAPRGLPGGVYFAVLRWGGETRTGRFAVVR